MKFELGFTGILTIIFVFLKAFDKIDWSWWWVFSPLWISALIIIGILLICFICIIINAVIKK
jgi:hypothetical protein